MVGVIYLREKSESHHVFVWKIAEYSKTKTGCEEEHDSPHFTTLDNWGEERKWQIRCWPKCRCSSGSTRLSLYNRSMSRVELSVRLSVVCPGGEIRFTWSTDGAVVCKPLAWISIPDFMPLGLLEENLEEDTLYFYLEMNFGSGEMPPLPSSISLASDPPPTDEELKASSTQILISDIGSLFHIPAHSDLTIKVGETNFPVHKSIIACRCAVLKAMFKNSFSGTENNVLTILDFEKEAVYNLLRFIYRGDIGEDAPLESVLKAGYKYGLIQLTQLCSQRLQNTLAADNVWQRLLVAESIAEYSLKYACFNYIADNLTEVLGSSHYDDLLTNNKDLAKEAVLYAHNAPQRMCLEEKLVPGKHETVGVIYKI